MSLLPKCLIKDMPSYYELIQFENVSRETSEKTIDRLINKINEYSGGND